MPRLSSIGLHAAEQQRLINNIVMAMQGVPPEIQERQVAHFTQADPAFGSGVAKGLGLVADAVT